MPFTEEQVEKALSSKLRSWPPFEPRLSQLQQTSNYRIVLDYLTGKSNSLQGAQYDNSVYYWAPLLNLLENIERPSANDQLVLDVVFDPTMTSGLQGNFMAWLVLYMREHDTDRSFLAALNYLRKTGSGDDYIFEYIMTWLNSTYTPEDMSLDEHKPLKNFLSSYVKGSKHLWMPRNGVGPTDWSFLYLRLLEEVRPEWVMQYVQQGILVRNSNVTYLLATYRNGHYHEPLIDFLRDQQNPNKSIIQTKFATALTLYQKDGNKYKGLALELAQQFLDHCRIYGNPYIRWEAGHDLKTFDDERLVYPGYTSLAFHLLLKYDREKGLREIEDVLERKDVLPFLTLVLLYHHTGQDALPYILRAIKTPETQYYKEVSGLLKQYFQPQQYIETIWQLADTKSKPLKELIASTVAENDPGAEAKAITLLENKNSETRQTAAIILSRFSSPTAVEAINKVLNKETNDNARDILLQTIADSLPQNAGRELVDDMVAAAKERGKLKKPTLKEDELPPLYFKDGTQVNTEAVRFLMYRMGRVKTMRSDPEARLLIQQIDKQRSGAFAMYLMKLYIDQQAKPEDKYLMATAALLGDDAVVDKIRTTINNWIDSNRAKMAEHGVGALALHGSDKALRWVEWYSRKYKNKKANVGQAATLALETAAEELQITPHELGDRVVPDFGFDGLFRNFTMGNDEYRAFIDSNFKIAFFNEDNKKLKSLPAAASAELKDEFKNIAKEVRDVVKSQSSRLEHYLVVQRRWTNAQWQQFFLNNPVMFIYATKLLWGIYENEQLKECFLCQEDTTLTNENDEEIELPGEAMIGIVHPMQLTPEQLQAWRRKFFDQSIEPIFPQLERPFGILTDEEKQTRIVRKFMGVKADSGSVRSALEKDGWSKAGGDGGHIDFFTYTHHAGHIRAVLEVEGVFVFFIAGQEATLGRLFFIDTSKETSRWYNTPGDEKDERLIALENLPPVFYSEVMGSIGAIKPRG